MKKPFVEKPLDAENHNISININISILLFFNVVMKIN